MLTWWWPVRGVQPNTPCLVGESASAMCLGGKATDADGDVVQALFAAVGKMHRVCPPTLPPFYRLNNRTHAEVRPGNVRGAWCLPRKLADVGPRRGQLEKLLIEYSVDNDRRKSKRNAF